jgi:hypothetical protein
MLPPHLPNKSRPSAGQIEAHAGSCLADGTMPGQRMAAAEFFLGNPVAVSLV